MGQCSTLPSDTHNSGGGGASADPFAPTSRSKRHASTYHSHQQSHHQPQQRDDADDGNRSDVVMTDVESRNSQKQQNVNGLVNVVKTSINAFEPYMNDQHQKGGSSSRRRANSQASEGREGPVILPPDAAERKRCYRLNLELPPEASIDSATGQTIYGPHIYEPPPHHLPQPNKKNFRKSHSWHSATAGMTALQVSNSDEASAASSSKSATAVAISTAQIFRGITVDKNGTILTQNARASRSSKNKGDEKKRGEKSRQAAKIDKAKDLVDDAVNGVSATDGDSSKMVSLVIMGEYDDMKHLVRDGSKKLRDASNLPDDALLSINRQRTTSSSFAGSSHGAGSPSMSTPNRKRISPYGAGSNAVPIPSTGSKSRSSRAPQSAPPKLKAHPRDRSSSRRYGGGNGSEGEACNSQCNDIPIFGPRDSDWSDALNFSNRFHSIWNCGATGGSSTGTMSPTNPASPSHKTMNSYVASQGRGAMPMAREGRNEAAYRGGGDRSERIDAMGNVVV